MKQERSKVFGDDLTIGAAQVAKPFNLIFPLFFSSRWATYIFLSEEKCLPSKKKKKEMYQHSSPFSMQLRKFLKIHPQKLKLIANLCTLSVTSNSDAIWITRLRFANQAVLPQKQLIELLFGIWSGFKEAWNYCTVIFNQASGVKLKERGKRQEVFLRGDPPFCHLWRGGTKGHLKVSRPESQILVRVGFSFSQYREKDFWISPYTGGIFWVFFLRFMLNTF